MWRLGLRSGVEDSLELGFHLRQSRIFKDNDVDHRAALEKMWMMSFDFVGKPVLRGLG